MKYTLVVMVIVAIGAGRSVAEAKSHAKLAARPEDRQMYAEPERSAPQTPTFHWSGPSSWAAPGASDRWSNSSANGS